MRDIRNAVRTSEIFRKALFSVRTEVIDDESLCSARANGTQAAAYFPVVTL
jgi:hypothetical protein